MRRTRERGKHIHSGAWVIHKRRSCEGLKRLRWYKTWISLSTRRWYQRIWQCCSSYAQKRQSLENMPRKRSHLQAITRHPTIVPGQTSWLAMLWPWSNLMRRVSCACADRLLHSNPREPGCAYHITSRCLRMFVEKLDILKRGLHA